MATLIQQAEHGYNVVDNGNRGLRAYPFASSRSALAFLNNFNMIRAAGMLGSFDSLLVQPDEVLHSDSFFKRNEEKVEGIIALARAKQDGKARPSFPFFDYESSPLSVFSGLLTGRTSANRTAAGASMMFAQSIGRGSRVPLDLKWPVQFREYVTTAADTLQASPTPRITEATNASPVVSAEVTQGLGKVVSVESIDPRKIPLLHYVNAELLPDAPKDDDDVSTEACYKRQAKTIGGLLADLRKRTEDLGQERTSHEITKSKLKAEHDEVLRLDQKVGVQASTIRISTNYNSVLRDELNATREQVLKNRESIAVVKYSQRDHEWHLVQNGIAWRAPYRDPSNTLVQIANSINLGKNSVGSFGLTRKPCYYKEDYA